MAISSINTFDLLNKWQQYMYEDVWVFNQVLGTGVIDTEKPVYIQGDRDMIARGINYAYEMVSRYLGFPASRRYIEDEVLSVQYYRHIQYQQFQAKRGHLLGFGKRATTLLEADAGVIYSQVYNPKTDDTATITATVPTGTNPDEVQIFFRTADGAPSAANPQWRISPVQVSVVGTVATITGPRAYFVKPGIWMQAYTDPDFYDRRNFAQTSNPADFITEVDVYRVYRDTTNAVQIGYRTCGTCAPEWVDVEGCIVDGRLGLFEIHGNACPTYSDYPLRLRVSYEAGPDTDDPQLLQAVFRLANVNMPRCPNNITDLVTRAWDNDTKIEDIAMGRQDNPFGVYRGAVAAYSIVENRMLRT